MRIFIRFLLLVVLLLSVAVLVYRGVYDFNLIRRGDTIVVKKTSPDGYDYLLHIPRGYNDFSGPQPLLIFLHGAGERGTDPRTLRKKSPAFIAKNAFKRQETSSFPFLIVSPICPGSRWEPHRVIATLDQVLADGQFRFPIDTDRIYLTGYSMGGFGTFETAMEYPERFAAIVPVSGGGEPDKAEKLLDVAVWVFHGEEDTTVPMASSSLVVERLRELGHKDIMMTTFPKAGHGVAQEVYCQESFYRQLLLKRKSRVGENESVPPSSFPSQPPTSDEPESVSLDNGMGSDAGDLVDGGASGENFIDPVVP
jgi:predicted esterase